MSKLASAFADVPIPQGMSRLPIVGRGMPVPWTTMYTEGDDDPVSIVDTTRGRELRCSCVLGRGRPHLGKPCAHRQRKGITERRCVMCGRRVVGRETFVGATKNRVLDVNRPVWTSIEPPAHPPCAAYALLACPHLAGADGGAFDIGVTSQYDTYKHVAVDFSGTKAKGYAAPLDYEFEHGVVDIYTAVLRGARIMSAHTWMTTLAPEPYRRLWVERLR